MTKTTCLNHKRQAIQATIVNLDTATATLQIDTPDNNSCIHCQHQGGCQSLSIYQLLFSKHPITIENQGYAIGQQLIIDFPEDIIQKTVCYLLGLPLAFALGALFASIGLLLGRKQVRKQLHRLHITAQ